MVRPQHESDAGVVCHTIRRRSVRQMVEPQGTPDAGVRLYVEEEVHEDSAR